MNYIENPYVFKFDYNEEETIVFNSDGGAIILLPKEKLYKNKIDVSKLSSEELAYMVEERILVDSKLDMICEMEKRFNLLKGDVDVLKISIEITTNCNFSCLYCYQYGWEQRECISNDIIEKIFLYVQKCIEIKGYTTLVVNLIGGEPLLYKEKIAYIAQKMRAIRDLYNIKIKAGIDTNGYYLDSNVFRILNDIDTNISVTLSLPDDHNTCRPLKNKQATFDRILDNLKKCSPFFKYSTYNLFIRYNVNGDNIHCFSEFLDLLLQNEIFVNAIHPMYTYEHYNTKFRNQLTFEEYKKWNSSIAIDEMVKRGYIITEYLEGNNTYNKIKDKIDIPSEEVFDDWESTYKRERFINELLSKNLKFFEALNYSKYLAEETEYITMHKTKGSSIESVIVVMDEFFWNEYNFSSLYSSDDSNVNRIINSKKLIYVACSRAMSRLVCVRVLTPNEVDLFKRTFPYAEQIEE